MQGGEGSTGEGQLKRQRSGGNTALGVLLLLIAFVLYPTSNLVAIGIGLLGLYLILGGRL